MEREPDPTPPGKPDPSSKPCPVCGRPASKADAPFCSRRCADVDLHRWLGGVYRVPTEEDGGGEPGAGPA